MSFIDLWGYLTIPEPNTGCLLWLGKVAGTHNGGRPAANFGGRTRYVAQLVHEEDIGRPLLPGEVTRHKCQNHLCINRAHLTHGSQSDNMMDRDPAKRKAQSDMARSHRGKK